MERFVKGDVVVVPFPLSDLSRAKRRPALVIADIVLYRAGHLKPEKVREVADKVVEMLRQ